MILYMILLNIRLDFFSRKQDFFMVIYTFIKTQTLKKLSLKIN